MTLDRFEELFYDALRESMEPRGCTLSRTMIHRNNEDVAGLILCRDFTQVGIVLYPKELYDDWKNGRTMDEIVFDVREDILFKRIPMLDIQSFDREQAEKKLMACVVGYEKNKDWLQHIPHQRVEDMALYARWYVADDASIVVSNEILGQLRMTKEEMLSKAQANQRRTANFYPLENYLFGFDDIEIFQREFNGTFDRSVTQTAHPMYILGSSRSLQGASVALDSMVLKAVRDCLDSDFYVLPSSIHETIILPANQLYCGVDELKQMVCHINSTDVPVEDKLTDNVYHFDGHKLTIAGATQKKTVSASMEIHRHKR